MRIGIYDPYLDDLGGGEKYMMTIAQCLSKAHKVDIFWDNKQDLDDLIHRFSLNLSKVELVPNIFSKRYSTFQRLIATKKYDVIFFLSDGSFPLVSAKKLLVHIQQPLAHMQTVSLFEKVKLARVTKFFCNSEYTKSFIDRKFSLKTSILYPPVYLFSKDIKKENIILHVGRFRVKNVSNGDYKKQSVMIEAFKEMVNNGLKGWEFVLAVSILQEDKVKFAALQKKAAGYPIRFLINQTNDKLWDVYNRAKIYWHASGYGEDLKRYPEFAEHFGISTVEAMGAGAVPVVINAGGQKEIVNDGENGFRWDTLEELQKKTRQLINDKELWQTISQNARMTANGFSGERFCREVYELVK